MVKAWGRAEITLHVGRKIIGQPRSRVGIGRRGDIGALAMARALVVAEGNARGQRFGQVGLKLAANAETVAFILVWGIQPGILEPTIALLETARKAEADRIRQWPTNRRFTAEGVIAGIAEINETAKFLARPGCDEVGKAAARCSPKQRSLWATQNFNPGQVVNRKTGGVGRTQIDIVDIDRVGRFGGG